jgi:hypothetical protein
MQRQIIESSLIQSIGYDEARQVLQIEFKRGEVRDYKNIPKQLHHQFITAESKGKFYLKHIREKFNYD